MVEFTIYSMGDASFLSTILNSVAMITDHQTFFGAVKVGMLLGVLSVVFSGISKGGRSVEFQHVFVGFLIFSLMFVPKARVLIEDSYNGSVENVDNVPLGVALTGGIISTVGYRLTELMETAYGPGAPYLTQNEFADSLKILTDIRKHATKEPIWNAIDTANGGGYVNMKDSWLNYIKECTLAKIDLGLMDARDLVNIPFRDALNFPSSMMYTKIYVQAGNSAGQTKTCGEAFTELDSKTDFTNSQLSDSLNKIVNIKNGETSAMSRLNNSTSLLLGASIAGKDYMTASVLEPITLLAAENRYKDLLDTSGAMMVNQAIQTRNTSWATQQTMFMTIVRPLMTFFEGFIYAVTPIMAFMIVLGEKGISLAAKYIMILVWIAMWTPVLSIINLYIYMAASGEMANLGAVSGYTWDSFYALSDSTNRLQNWIATGGLLASATPAISLMLVYGTSTAATSLAGRLGSAESIKSHYQTPELATGSAIAAISPRMVGNEVGGLYNSGYESVIGNAGSSINMSSVKSSLETKADQASQAYGSSLTNAVMSGNNVSDQYNRLSTLGASSAASHDKVSNATRAVAQDISQFAGRNDGLTNAIQGAIQLKAFAGASVKTDDLVNAVFGSSAQDADGNLARSALSTILDGAGNSSSNPQSLGDSLNKASSIIKTGGGADASASANATQTTSVGQSSGNRSTNADSFRFAKNDMAAFKQNVTASHVGSHALSDAKTWGTSDKRDLTDQARDVSSVTQAYQASDQLLRGFGATNSGKLNDIAGMMTQSTPGGGDSLSTQLKREAKSLPPGVHAAALGFEQTYFQAGLGSGPVPSTMALMRAMINPESYRSGKTYDYNSMNQGMQMYQRYLSKTMGGDTSDPKYNADENIRVASSSPRFGSTTREVGDLREPPKQPYIDGPPRTMPTVNDVVQGNHAGSQAVENVFGTYNAETGAAASGFSREVQQEAVKQARGNVIAAETPDMASAQTIWGAADQAENQRDRVMTTAGDFLANTRFGQAYNASFGADTDNSPAGQAAAAIRGGQNVQSATQNMSTVDKIGAFIAAYQQSSGNGSTSEMLANAQAFWNANGAEMKSLAGNLATSAGLNEQQSAYFSARMFGSADEVRSAEAQVRAQYGGDTQLADKVVAIIDSGVRSGDQASAVMAPLRGLNDASRPLETGTKP